MTEPARPISVEGKITIKVGSVELILTAEEARGLHFQLGSMLGSNPSYPVYPIFPSYPNSGTRDPWGTTIVVSSDPAKTSMNNPAWFVAPGQWRPDVKYGSAGYEKEN